MEEIGPPGTRLPARGLKLHRPDPIRAASVGADTGRLLLRGGRLANGSFADVAIDRSSGLITEVGRPVPLEGDVDEDCRGKVILPAGVETHAHLDKAFVSTDQPAPADLDAGVAEWFAHVGELSHESFVERATSAIETLDRKSVV